MLLVNRPGAATSGSNGASTLGRVATRTFVSRTKYSVSPSGIRNGSRSIADVLTVVSSSGAESDSEPDQLDRQNRGGASSAASPSPGADASLSGSNAMRPHPKQ